MSKVPVTLNINGRDYQLEVEPQQTLLEVIREDLALTGTKSNCQEGECGACTVLADGKAVNSCLYLALRAQGKRITTIEGIADHDELHRIQEAFVRHGAVQCGYCTPGFVISAVGLFLANPRPTDGDLTRAMSGCICRCTGYVNIRRALRSVREQG